MQRLNFVASHSNFVSPSLSDRRFLCTLPGILLIGCGSTLFTCDKFSLESLETLLIKTNSFIQVFELYNLEGALRSNIVSEKKTISDPSGDTKKATR